MQSKEIKKIADRGSA